MKLNLIARNNEQNKMWSLPSTSWAFALTTITLMLIIQQHHSVTDAASQQQQHSLNPYVQKHQYENQMLQQQQQQQMRGSQNYELQMQLQLHQQQQQQQQQQQPRRSQNYGVRSNDKSDNINKNIDYDNDVEVDDDNTNDIHNYNRKFGGAGGGGGVGGGGGGTRRVLNYQQPTRASHINKNTKCKIWVPIDALDKYPLASHSSKQIDPIRSTQLIEVCCDGYEGENYLGSYICRPICEGCQNGFCRAPGVCECYDEYVMNDNGECVFACPLGCLNGRCFLDGSCQCNIGYKLDESRKFCRPICSMGCGESPIFNCTEPEVCSCGKGYTLKENGCKAVCDPDCGDGGVCLKTNDCQCRAGYTLKDGTCQAECYQKCENGYCVAQNRCICKPGFTYHEQSTHCMPI